MKERLLRTIELLGELKELQESDTPSFKVEYNLLDERFDVHVFGSFDEIGELAKAVGTEATFSDWDEEFICYSFVIGNVRFFNLERKSEDAEATEQ